ncbi:MAG: MFS transporter [Chloroflexi bacterium]|nr:MFS transporter [Chloroflexota bacterium]
MASDGAPRTARQGGIFYGWYIVAAVFFMVFVSIGFRQSYGLFLPSWREEFGVSISFLSTVAFVGWMVNGVAQPVVGGLADRYGARVVGCVSIGVLGLSAIAMTLSFNIWVLAFFYATFASFANAGAMFTPITPLIARWFVRKRGAALSIITAGGSGGAMLLIPFAAYLLDLANWRVALAVIAGIMLVLVLPLLLVVVRNRPAAMGLRPDGDTAAMTGGPQRPQIFDGPLAVSHWRQAYRSAPMWQLTLTYVVCGITTAIIAVHFVSFAKTEGINEKTAALAFGLLSFANMSSVLVMGIFISDRVQRKNSLTVIYAVRGLGFLALLVMPGTTGLWVFAVVAGGSWLATVPQTSALTAEVYGVRNVGSITGMLTMVHMCAGALAVLAAGLTFDYFGSYDPVWVVSVVLLAGASFLAWTLREREVSARYMPMRLAEA